MNMKSGLKIFLVFGFLFLVLCNTMAYGQVASMKNIVIKPDEFNGKIIEVEGEAIGELLIDTRSNGFWLNLGAEGYNISIFSSDRAHFSKVKEWGQYGQTGDWVKVKGIFKRDCPQHQISDIHLYSLEVLKKGYKKEILVLAWKVMAAIGLLIICLTSAIIYFIKANYGART
jgi:hypothetical protein